MLGRILSLAFHNRVFVAVLAVLGVVAGIAALVDLPVDAFPDTTPVQVQVNTVASALNPEEVERQITFPIETAIGGLPGLENVRSISKFGFSQVVATFKDGTSIYDARQLVFEQIGGVELPDGIDRPALGPIATGLGEVFHYLVTSTDSTRTLEEVRTLHDSIIRPELRRVPGVAEVNSWGGYEKQYEVNVEPRALLAYRLTLDDVVHALEQNNRNVGGGTLQVSGEDVLVHGVGRLETVRDIENVAIASHDGVPVRIANVGAVHVGHEIRRGAVAADGKGEALLGLAFMLMGESSHDVTKRLEKRLERNPPRPSARSQGRSRVQPQRPRRPRDQHGETQPALRCPLRRCRAIRPAGQHPCGAHRRSDNSAGDDSHRAQHARARHRSEPAEPRRARLRHHRGRCRGDGREQRPTPGGALSRRRAER
jgi:cobalt-zinc-cadmium resistance protein CzcA